MTMNCVNDKFYDIFDEIESEFDEISELVQAVEVMSDHKLYIHYIKRLKNIEEIAKKYKKYKQLDSDLQVLEDLCSENLEDTKNEIEDLRKQKEELLRGLKSLYLATKSKENEQVEIEISSKDDLEMVAILKGVFSAFADREGFECCEQERSEDSVKIKICGENIYSYLKTFSGKIKRVYRGVDSFASVVVLKTEDEDISLKEEDLEIQTSRSGGAGGQHINKTESAVKIIHTPTGLFAECQDERSQNKNKEKAMIALQRKLEQYVQEKQKKNIKNQRNEIKNKIFATTAEMVFDFDANKVLLNSNKTEYKLKEILSGDLSQIINNQVN